MDVADVDVSCQGNILLLYHGCCEMHHIYSHVWQSCWQNPSSVTVKGVKKLSFRVYIAHSREDE